jgi:hypothetical protein
MKNNKGACCVLTCLLFLHSATSRASDLAVDFQWAWGTDGWRADMPFTVGWTFTTASNISITSLGVLDIANHNAHNVGLWSASGTLLASQNVTLQSPSYTSPQGSAFRFESIQPVTLMAGNSYTIGAEYTPELYLDFYTYSLRAGSVVNSCIRYGSAVQGPNNTGLVFPSTVVADKTGFFGPNFLFEPVPEPRTVYLLATGLVILGFRFRRKIFSVRGS